MVGGGGWKGLAWVSTAPASLVVVGVAAGEPQGRPGERMEVQVKAAGVADGGAQAAGRWGAELPARTEWGGCWGCTAGGQSQGLRVSHANFKGSLRGALLG